MSRKPYFDKNGMRKGPWSKDEDDKLRAYIERYGHWNWREIPRFAGVARCGKSCRLRWMNYLRPNMKHGNFTKEEEEVIMELHKKIGNKWATIAAKLPGRSDNEIKNYWNTHLRKRAKQEQKDIENVHDETLESDQANPIKSLVENSERSEDMDEVEALWASLSSEISLTTSPSLESLSPSSYSSSTFDITSSMLSFSDSLVSSGDSIQTSNNGFDKNFWTNPFRADYDHGSMRSTEYVTDLDLVDCTLINSASCDGMNTSDEFLRSTMEFYSEYHSQFTK